MDVPFLVFISPYRTIACHSERSVSEVEESLRFKILRLFAVANFALQTTQDDSKLSVLDNEDKFIIID